jgi:hypothetical protein
MSDDHGQKRPQDNSRIGDTKLPLVPQSAENPAEKVRRVLGKELAARL